MRSLSSSGTSGGTDAGNPDKQKKVLMVIANSATSTTLGIPVGFWGAELTHAWYAFKEAGYEVTVASPDGGKCELDAWSDPRDESRYSFGDLITMGFLNTPEYMQLIEDTPALNELDYDDYDALVVVGGQSPMFTFREHDELKDALRTFYEGGKVTSALCHGTAALIDVTLSDGTPLIAGKTMTGFADVEEEYADQYVGTQVMPWHIEDAAKERGANYIQGGRFKPFAIRDGQLITGQQQYSGDEVAKLVIEALGI
ncbi:MAG TPA: type 1 glutamine amidotransferase domain-containing protein [Gaiellaceae bacterium]|jgi:putative intracellular protease/amidase|nr:type 1 glutamine amidotransferase domain-containing protein [Gaiellaceae bacterium]